MSTSYLMPVTSLVISKLVEEAVILVRVLLGDDPVKGGPRHRLQPLLGRTADASHVEFLRVDHPQGRSKQKCKVWRKSRERARLVVPGGDGTVGILHDSRALDTAYEAGCETLGDAHVLFWGGI